MPLTQKSWKVAKFLKVTLLQSSKRHVAENSHEQSSNAILSDVHKKYKISFLFHPSSCYLRCPRRVVWDNSFRNEDSIRTWEFGDVQLQARREVIGPHSHYLWVRWTLESKASSMCLLVCFHLNTEVIITNKLPGMMVVIRPSKYTFNPCSGRNSSCKTVIKLNLFVTNSTGANA